MMFIAIRTDDGMIKGKISFYCKVLGVSRQGFNNYLKTKDRPWKYQSLADAMMDINMEDECNDTYGRIRMYQALQLMPLTADKCEQETPLVEEPKETQRAAEQKEETLLQKAELFPNPPAPRRQHTIIAEGDEVRGDLRCIGDFELYGTLTGNVTGSGSLMLCGTLTGDAEGATARVRGGCVRGNLSIAERVEVDSDSVVLGDIKAQSLALGGKVRGNLDIAQSLALAGTAAVLGKISTGRLSVAEGAIFQSEVSIPTADFDSIFQKTKKPGESAGRT